MTRLSRSATVLALAAATLAACAPMERREAERAPAARALGQAQSCIPIAQIRESRVHDDYTIDLHTSGGQVYRNVLPHRCSGLGFEESFTYSTSLTQLCSTDIISVIGNTGGGIDRRASCGLGQFQPVELVKE